ncbi:MAG: hypothetical protein K2M00_08120, partial [Muribaculaceae bacterium]|nr:hypothetical protein [Muribaculaceae bacterium]
VIKYDSRYRPAVEGTVVTTKTHSQLWQRMDTSMLVEQVRPALDMNLFYTETSGLGTFTPHRAWLYDSYDFIPSWLNIKYLGFDIKKTDKANTLQTATVALRNNIPVVTAQWYDGYGRVTATIEYDVLGQNYCLRQYNTYDFRGNMTQSVTRMETLAEQQVQSSREYHLMTTYDRADRPVSVKYRTSPSAVWQELTNYAYDAVGRLNQEGGSAVKVQYGYDIRDHLTSISSPVFSQTMHYGIYNNAFNENYITAISEDYHDSAIAAVTNSYTYDNGGRLTGVSGARYTETYQYDLNSNVTKIVQNYNGSRIPFNNLSLLYDGNQVVTVTQTGTNLLAGELIAIPAGNHAQAIKYDANGRTIADASRNISSITYHPWLNLTNHITLGTGSSVDLQYTSGGELYQLSENERYIKQLSSIINPTDSTRKVTYGTRTVRTDRYGNFENRTGTGWRLYTPAGYYSWTDSTNHYVVRDYLGSTRVVYKPVKKSTRPLLASPDLAISSGSYTVEQRTGYFANGTPVNLSEGSSTTRLHTGKEWLNLEGIGLYDNAARLHDPLLGRFTTADALADKYHYLSPYTHCAGNPVNYLDLDGNDIYTFNDQGEIKITPHDTEDIIRFDENGSDVLTFPKGTIIKHTYIENIKVWVENESKYKYYNVDLLEVRGDDAAMDLYYTLQSRINVEFTLQMMGEEGDKGFNAITTSHSINTDVGTGFVNTNKYFYDYTIRKHFHNHPSNSNNPSKPDVTLWTEIDNHSNICRKYIYTTTEGFVEYRQIFKDGVINYERVY